MENNVKTFKKYFYVEYIETQKVIITYETTS